MLSEPQGLVRPEGLGKLKKFILLIASRTRDPWACSTVTQPLHQHSGIFITMKITASWHMTPCSLRNRDETFRRTLSLHVGSSSVGMGKWYGYFPRNARIILVVFLSPPGKYWDSTSIAALVLPSRSFQFTLASLRRSASNPLGCVCL
jgi:hypothetical protein